MDDPEVPLRLHLEKIIDERTDALWKSIAQGDKLYQSQFTSTRELLLVAIQAQKDSTAIALAASDKAADKAEEAQRQYNISSNEFRTHLDDYTKLLCRKSELCSVEEALNARMTNLRETLDRTFTSQGKDISSIRESQGASGAVRAESHWNIGTWISMAIALSALLAALLKGKG